MSDSQKPHKWRLWTAIKQHPAEQALRKRKDPFKPFPIKSTKGKGVVFNLFIISAAHAKSGYRHKQKDEIGKRRNDRVINISANLIITVCSYMHHYNSDTSDSSKTIYRSIMFFLHPIVSLSSAVQSTVLFTTSSQLYFLQIKSAASS